MTNPGGAFESLVSPAQSADLIAAVEKAALERHDGDRRVGLFGPGSIIWRVNRESALFLGAGRAALLQLAHPWVATALEQHSSLMHDPLARFHNTFRIVFAMIFGSLDQALASARHLYRLHTHIQGELSEAVGAWPRGTHYEANQIPALRWVYATLLESAVLAYECVRPPLRPVELDGYYSESKMLASLFGLSSSALPPDWPAFLRYCREAEQSATLGVNASARTMAHSLLAGAGSWVKPPHWYRALTIGWLPERLRVEFGLVFGNAEISAAKRSRRWLPRVYSGLPAMARFVGPWHEAQARLAKRRPGPLTRVGNRFWIGDTRLPFGEDFPD